MEILEYDSRSIYHSHHANWQSELDNSYCGFTR